jgi:hypothetical protein
MTSFGCPAPQPWTFATHFADGAVNVRSANSTSVMLKVTKIYFFVFQITGAPATKTKWPPV